MKKSKILVLALTSVMATSVFGLAGCTGGGGDGGGSSTIEHTQHTYGNWEHNSTQHWRKCTSSGCTAEEREDHKYNGGYTCAVCGYVNESLKPGEPQSMSTYFSGMKTTATRASVKDADNVTKSFDEVLDRQLDVFAQDILYRLNYIYGTNGTNRLKTELGEQLLYNTNNNVFNLNGAIAKVNDNKVIVNNINHSHSNELNLNCDDCIQSFLNNYESSTNYIYNKNYLNLYGAITGDNTSLNVVQLIANSSNSWKWANNSENTLNFVNINKNNFKMAVAQILTNSNLDGIYNASKYNDLLKNINQLGINSNYKNNIVNFINNNVIGNSLIEKDNTIYDSNYFKQNNYVINSNFMVNAPYPGNSNYSDLENENSPRLYKGYNIIVPAIVEQALNNTFEGTTQTIYPSMNRYATDYNSNVFTTSTSNFDSIVLAPRTSTPATKLVVKIEGTGNNVELTIGCSVNGSNASSNQKKVRLSASGETVEFDLHSYSTIGSYNGSTEKDTNNDLFANNQTSKNSSDGSNYIKLVFTNPSNAMFRVTFTGYYNK
mgnify:CR=1 FL=1